VIKPSLFSSNKQTNPLKTYVKAKHIKIGEKLKVM